MLERIFFPRTRNCALIAVYGRTTSARPPFLSFNAELSLMDQQINRNIIPTFYRVLQEQEQQKQIANAQELRNAFNLLITAAHPRGPYFMGSEISFVDIQAAPWVLRLRRVLKPYRGWPDSEEGSRFASWVTAIETNEHVRSTTSTDKLYLDSYQRYAGEYAYPYGISLTCMLTPGSCRGREPPEHVSGRRCYKFWTRSPINSCWGWEVA